MGSWSMTGQQPVACLNMNDRDHHRVEYVKKRAWKDDAYWRANRGRKPTISGLAHVQVDFGVRDPERRRDPHNWFPTVKCIIDGLTLAKLWPDDSSEWVHALEPRFTKRSSRLDTYTVTITWEEPDV